MQALSSVRLSWPGLNQCVHEQKPQRRFIHGLPGRQLWHSIQTPPPKDRPKTVAHVVATRDLHTSAWHAPTLRRLQMADGHLVPGPCLPVPYPSCSYLSMRRRLAGSLTSIARMNEPVSERVPKPDVRWLWISASMYRVVRTMFRCMCCMHVWHPWGCSNAPQWQPTAGVCEVHPDKVPLTTATLTQHSFTGHRCIHSTCTD